LPELPDKICFVPAVDFPDAPAQQISFYSTFKVFSGNADENLCQLIRFISYWYPDNVERVGIERMTFGKYCFNQYFTSQSLAFTEFLHFFDGVAG
jgi:hypothetical protein